MKLVGALSADTSGVHVLTKLMHVIKSAYKKYQDITFRHLILRYTNVTRIYIITTFILYIVLISIL